MKENIRNIAMRIKEVREIAGVSLETLAHEFSISPQTYQEYESGMVDIPVSFLFKVAHRFSVELTDLLTGESPRLHIYSLVKSGTGPSIERRRQYQYRHLAYNFMHRKAEPFLVTVEPELSESPMSFSSHPGQEFNYLLEGRMKIVVDDHELILNPGDSLYFDSGYRHGMRALDNKPAKFLAIVF
ncbi:MAG TPA: XRE family transcriptional regulator [Geobacteraceae bacterium]|nr:XRE family transcriptional regulator [Geobacteraceae bacterium]